MHKKLLHGILCSLLLVLLAGCGAGRTDGTPSKQEKEAADAVKINEDYINEIKDRGYLIIGCKTDVPGLSYYDEKAKNWSGLEVELAYRTAANVFEVSVDEAKEQGLVQLVGVTVADREEKLENGEVDCLLATYTITEERARRFAFSDSYYTDYIGLMVLNSGDNPNSLGTSDIRSIADLDGKYVGVSRNATTRETFLDYIGTMNSLKVTPIFFEYADYPALFDALQAGSIDVMAVDVSILNGYADNSTAILNDRFGGQHYGAAVRKENAKLLDAVNKAIAQFLT